MTRTALRWEFVARTSPGRARDHNEDSFFIDEAHGLAVVADGMGGHKSGEVASALAVAVIRDLVRASAPAGDPPVPAVTAKCCRLGKLVEAANLAVFERSRASGQDVGMGTTLVVVLADEVSLAAAHIGDSRLYLHRGGVLTRLTEDHSLAVERLRSGLITAQEAERPEWRSVLTRALGTEERTKPDIVERPVEAGDMILLATDGLTHAVGDAEMARIFKERSSPSAVAAALIEAVARAGGADDVTVVCGRFSPNSAGDPDAVTQPFAAPRNPGDASCPLTGLWNRVRKFFNTGDRSP